MKLERIYAGAVIMSFIFIFSSLIAQTDINDFNISASIEEATNKNSPIIEWSKTFDTHNLSSVDYGNGVYVAVGEDGVIKFSSDASTWSIARNKPIWLQGVIYGNNRFIAVGSQGTILTSSDGKTWDSMNSGTIRDLKSIAWSGSMFAIVGDRGTLLTSSDGLTWAQIPLDIQYSFSSIISGNGKFIACTSGTFNTVLVSDNGSDWYTIEPLANHYGYYNAIFDHGIFLISGKVSNSEDLVMLKSNDGLSWTQVSNPPAIKSITANGKSFIAIGNSKKDQNDILTQYLYVSEDGETWRTHEIKWSKNSYSDIRYIYWCEKKYIGLMHNGHITSSLDALEWKKSASDISTDYDRIQWNGSNILAYNKDGDMLISEDGTKWTASPIDISIVKPILNIYNLGGKTIVIGGTPPTMYVSSDNQNWSYLNIDELEYSKLLWSGDKYLLITNLAIYISSDAIHWDKLDRPNNFNVSSVAWNNKTYVTVGGQSIIYGGDGNYSPSYRVIATSSNMEDWDVNMSENTFSLNAIVWVNEKFVAVGEGGTIITSSDGLGNWITQISGTTSDLLNIIWDGKRFIASGKRGTILYSKDGTTWSVDNNTTTSDYISQITWTGKKYVGLALNSILSGIPSIDSDAPALLIFNDIENHWAKSSISELASMNILKGFENNTFAPNNDITRAEFAAVIVRGLDLKDSEGTKSFSDVAETDWFYQTILTAFNNGIITGYEDGSIAPSKPITRQEAMAMISRALKYMGTNITLSTQEANSLLAPYRDNNTIDTWARPAVAACIKSTTVQGTDGSINPKGNITRAETATVVLRMLKK